MKLFTVVVTLVLFLTACSSSGDSETTSSGDSPTPMAAALEELVTKDHTFGSGPPPFSEYLIQSATDPNAGDGSGG
ncbi:MAG: hypothetical protein GY773_06345, partial [Actinomycetia bacterium]|nr:hypothetical protein [Actinomycetes bacterium]